MKQTLTLLITVVFCSLYPLSSLCAETKKIVMVAGKPSHPPRMHEFNAGVQLMADSLASVPDIDVKVVNSGWPKDESVFDGANAVIFYMDGGKRHEVVQEEGRRLKIVDGWASQGVGLGFMHYGVEILKEDASAEFKRWIGGHYENMHSCNPMWEPHFAVLPDHPITNGVKPFKATDEWYFNMRFVAGIDGTEAKEIEGLKFQPILLATPSDSVRDGPYVYPKGPYAHIQASKGRAEAMMWAVERPDGGRGFGFTGGHHHDNWGNDDYRKVVLNAVLWAAKVEVPANGVQSTVTPAQLDENLDPKPAKKPKKKPAKKKAA